MKKILIAEDDRTLLKLLDTVVSSQGYQVRTASDGATTLRLVKEFNPDLLLLDIMMPVIDGYHICKILSEDPQYSPVPKIVIITVRKEDWDKRISKFGGADAFISKPFNTDDVLDKIKELLD
ncbi:MAG: response regulator [Elusimicrobiota bacterium]